MCGSAWISVVLCLKDTATTEIYTYGHTHSLHDALPICLVGLDYIGIAQALAVDMAGEAPQAVAGLDHHALALGVELDVLRPGPAERHLDADRKSTRLNSSH